MLRNQLTTAPIKHPRVIQQVQERSLCDIISTRKQDWR